MSQEIDQNHLVNLS